MTPSQLFGPCSELGRCLVTRNSPIVHGNLILNSLGHIAMAVAGGIQEVKVEVLNSKSNWNKLDNIPGLVLLCRNSFKIYYFFHHLKPWVQGGKLPETTEI